MRPIHTELIWDGNAMSVNNEYELKCQTFGAQPSSVITWWINGDQQRKADRTEVRNLTFSHIKILNSLALIILLRFEKMDHSWPLFLLKLFFSILLTVNK